MPEYPPPLRCKSPEVPFLRSCVGTALYQHQPGSPRSYLQHIRLCNAGHSNAEHSVSLINGIAWKMHQSRAAPHTLRLGIPIPPMEPSPVRAQRNHPSLHPSLQTPVHPSPAAADVARGVEAQRLAFPPLAPGSLSNGGVGDLRGLNATSLSHGAGLLSPADPGGGVDVARLFPPPPARQGPLAVTGCAAPLTGPPRSPPSPLPTLYGPLAVSECAAPPTGPSLSATFSCLQSLVAVPDRVAAPASTPRPPPFPAPESPVPVPDHCSAPTRAHLLDARGQAGLASPLLTQGSEAYSGGLLPCPKAMGQLEGLAPMHGPSPGRALRAPEAASTLAATASTLVEALQLEGAPGLSLPLSTGSRGGPELKRRSWNGQASVPDNTPLSVLLFGNAPPHGTGHVASLLTSSERQAQGPLRIGDPGTLSVGDGNGSSIHPKGVGIIQGQCIQEIQSVYDFLSESPKLSTSQPLQALATAAPNAALLSPTTTVRRAVTDSASVASVVHGGSPVRILQTSPSLPETSRQASARKRSWVGAEGGVEEEVVKGSRWGRRWGGLIPSSDLVTPLLPPLQHKDKGQTTGSPQASNNAVHASRRDAVEWASGASRQLPRGEGTEGLDWESQGQSERSLADIQLTQIHQGLELAGQSAGALPEERKDKSRCEGAAHRVIVFGVELRPQALASKGKGL